MCARNCPACRLAPIYSCHPRAHACVCFSAFLCEFQNARLDEETGQTGLLERSVRFAAGDSIEPTRLFARLQLSRMKTFLSAVGRI